MLYWMRAGGARGRPGKLAGTTAPHQREDDGADARQEMRVRSPQAERQVLQVRPAVLGQLQQQWPVLPRIMVRFSTRPPPARSRRRQVEGKQHQSRRLRMRCALRNECADERAYTGRRAEQVMRGAIMMVARRSRAEGWCAPP